MVSIHCMPGSSIVAKLVHRYSIPTTPTSSLGMPFLRQCAPGEEYQCYHYSHIADVQQPYEDMEIGDPTSSLQFRSPNVLTVLLSQHTTENSVCFTHRGIRNEFPRSIAAPCHGYARGKRYPNMSLEITAVGFHFLGPFHNLRHLKFVRVFRGSQPSPMIGFLVDERDLLKPLWRSEVKPLPWCIITRLKPEEEANHLNKLETMAETVTASLHDKQVLHRLSQL